MSSMRAELSPTEREKLLRDLWVAHDGRWFLAAAAEFGFDTANRLNQAVVRSMGKKEAREFMIRSGAEIANASDFKEFLEMAGALYWPEEHKTEIEIVDGQPGDRARPALLRVGERQQGRRDVTSTAARRPSVSAAGWRASAFPARSSATSECDTCNGSCDISFRFDWPAAKERRVRARDIGPIRRADANS